MMLFFLVFQSNEKDTGYECNGGCNSNTIYRWSFIIPNNELVKVPKIVNILNVSSADNKDGLTNLSNTHYKPNIFIPIKPFIVSSIVDTITSSHIYTKTLIFKVVI